METVDDLFAPFQLSQWDPSFPPLPPPTSDQDPPPSVDPTPSSPAPTSAPVPTQIIPPSAQTPLTDPADLPLQLSPVTSTTFPPTFPLQPFNFSPTFIPAPTLSNISQVNNPSQPPSTQSSQPSQTHLNHSAPQSLPVSVPSQTNPSHPHLQFFTPSSPHPPSLQAPLNQPVSHPLTSTTTAATSAQPDKLRRQLEQQVQLQLRLLTQQSRQQRVRHSQPQHPSHPQSKHPLNPPQLSTRTQAPRGQVDGNVAPSRGRIAKKNTVQRAPKKMSLGGRAANSTAAEAAVAAAAHQRELEMSMQVQASVSAAGEKGETEFQAGQDLMEGTEEGVGRGLMSDVSMGGGVSAIESVRTGGTGTTTTGTPSATESIVRVSTPETPHSSNRGKEQGKGKGGGGSSVVICSKSRGMGSGRVAKPRDKQAKLRKRLKCCTHEQLVEEIIEMVRKGVVEEKIVVDMMAEVDVEAMVQEVGSVLEQVHLCKGGSEGEVGGKVKKVIGMARSKVMNVGKTLVEGAYWKEILEFCLGVSEVLEGLPRWADVGCGGLGKVRGGVRGKLEHLVSKSIKQLSRAKEQVDARTLQRCIKVFPGATGVKAETAQEAEADGQPPPALRPPLFPHPRTDTIPLCHQTMTPPHALRVLRLPDRLILHDLSSTLPAPDPTNRNALILSANRAHTRHSSSPQTLLDLPTPPPNLPPTYLSLPFQAAHPPVLAASPDLLNIPPNPPVDVAVGFLGILNLPSNRYCLLVDAVKEAGMLPHGMIYSVQRVRAIALAPVPNNPTPKSSNGGELLAGIVKLLESGAVYYMVDSDLTQGKPGFWWTKHMVDNLGVAAGWGLRCVYGFVGTRRMRCDRGEFLLTLVSRRSRRRAGTRYITRGVDGRGDVANFVESEQVVWREGSGVGVGYLVIRGSIPVFWRQNNGIARPAPEVDKGLLRESRAAFAKHFERLTSVYGEVCAVSLVDKGGSEGGLASAFERFMSLERGKGVRLEAFDFHKWCAGKEYERGLRMLMDRLKTEIERFGVGDNQKGVFRVNCVDCLDRTNVVQSMLARSALVTQLETVFRGAGGALSAESESGFKQVWGDNADMVSKQYSGTGALKTDFTRTGKRSTTGVIGDGVKSVMRMYYKNFVDEGRQEVIDVISGNVTVKEVGRGDGIWYSFQCLRINAGGDKQGVVVELSDDVMYVITGEGIATEYPRDGLRSWIKENEGKSKTAVARLRLWYVVREGFPATSAPLDLQFKGGPTARENFLRAVISWAKLESSVVDWGRREVRVRVLGGMNIGEHRMEDWGLDRGVEGNEVVALVIPESTANSRSFGLAAVPIDVDDSSFKLVSACAVSERGPAIAVIVSKRLQDKVMAVREGMSGQTASFAAGGAVGVAMEVCGTSLCFVSAKLNGMVDIFHTISSLKLGRQSFDISNQFHHFMLVGMLGDVQWRNTSSPRWGPEGRQWVGTADGSLCYSLQEGMSVIRHSFPRLRYDDRISANSFWRACQSSAMEPMGKAGLCMTLCDGVVDGRAGPSLPKEVKACTLVVGGLRAEGLKASGGAEGSAGMNWQVVLYCEFCAIDEVVSRTSIGSAGGNVEWVEDMRMPMMAVERGEVMRSFVIGMVVVPNALGDDGVVGHFVVAIGGGRGGEEEFEVGCRMGGRAVGKVSGKIWVESGDWGSDAGKKSMRAQGSREELPDAGVDWGYERRGKGKGKGMEEVNERLEVVRRKGSKQIKSVVSKLSGFLNQPSGGGSSVGGSKSAGVRKFRGDYGYQMDEDAGGLADFREVDDDVVVGGEGKGRSSSRVDDDDGFGRYQVAGGGTRVERRDAGQGIANVGTGDGLGNDSGRAGANASSSRGVVKRSDGDALALGLERLRTGEDGKHGGEWKRKSKPSHVMVGGEDLLLRGLQQERRRHTEDVDDDWGDFESAANHAGGQADDKLLF